MVTAFPGPGGQTVEKPDLDIADGEIDGEESAVLEGFERRDRSSGGTTVGWERGSAHDLVAFLQREVRVRGITINRQLRKISTSLVARLLTLPLGSVIWNEKLRSGRVSERTLKPMLRRARWTST